MTLINTQGTTHIDATLVKILGGLLLCCLPFLVTSSAIPSLLESIQRQGYLTIVSDNGPATYYEGPFGYTGFEYDLAGAFADDLGVELRIRESHHTDTLRNTINTADTQQHKADSQAYFIANNVIITAKRQQRLKFSQPYLQVKQQVIYRRGDSKPKTIADLAGKDIIVLANSPHADLLRQLQYDYPDLRWRELGDVEALDLLEAVHSDKADITLMDSATYTINRTIYPKARHAFDLATTREIAWAFPKTGDPSLYKAANRFLDDTKASGQLAELTKKYFDNTGFDEGGALTFSKHVEQRLHKWEALFKEAADHYQLDWLFLAAISYQESLWNPKAKSYTGVRGMMMLTKATAKHIGISNRNDPKQSIFGGAKYFSQVLKRLPQHIPLPDRQWMALAAYNVGRGHLEDARIITEQQGGNPNQWLDVKQRLPLLSKKKYYKKTKHGYARGWEPVRYVENIRSYYNTLVWHNESEQRRLASELQNQIQPLSFSTLDSDAPTL
ncbi:MAG: membrane-bound lytic murein transglycosylase MltF [Cellvibrionaceae bacterium]|nr:membrane-bound lytic murein transglycosylase MltF [Cellvibrionaceae bacterium]